MAQEIDCPEYLKDVMVSIGLNARYTSGKTISEVKGLGKYPKTEIGRFVLKTVDNAMLHVAHIKSLPEETRAEWSKLVLERYAVGFRLQQAESFDRSVSAILRSPTPEQKKLVTQYNELQERIRFVELQSSLFAAA